MGKRVRMGYAAFAVSSKHEGIGDQDVAVAGWDDGESADLLLIPLTLLGELFLTKQVVSGRARICA